MTIEDKLRTVASDGDEITAAIAEALAEVALAAYELEGHYYSCSFWRSHSSKPTCDCEYTTLRAKLTKLEEAMGDEPS